MAEPDNKKTSKSTDAKQVIETCRAMNRLGVNQGKAGNVSVKFRDGMLITPSGVDYDAMTAGSIVFINADAEWAGNWSPSSEWRMHHDIYRARPEAGAIVHAHSVHCTALACLHRSIPPFHYMVAVAGGDDIRCAGYATFGTQALSDTMLSALEGRTACLLANHGMICFASDLNGALALAVEVETLATQYLKALQIGDPVLLKPKQMAEALEKFKTYGDQPEQQRKDSK